MSTSSASSSTPLSSSFGHKASSSTATTASFTGDLKNSRTSSINYALAFNIPPQLYYLGMERSKRLEDRARRHFDLHSTWVYATARQDAAERAAKLAIQAVVEMRKEVANLEEEVVAAAMKYDEEIGAAFADLEQSKPLEVTSH